MPPEDLEPGPCSGGAVSLKVPGKSLYGGNTANVKLAS